MNPSPSHSVGRHVVTACHLLLVLACGLGAELCRAEEMATEVSTPLQEFKVKRLDIEKKAEAETTKELQMLIKKLEKVSKGKNKNPKANEQATQLLAKLKSPTFLATGLDQLIDDTQVGVSIKGAEIIALAYKQKRVTVEDWVGLPGDQIDVTQKKGEDTSIDVKAGDVVLVCPHPTQTWRKGPASDWTTYDGQNKRGESDLRQQMLLRVAGPAGAERFEVRDSVLIRSPMEGRLHLDSGGDKSGVSEGAITCKIFKVNAR